MKRKSLIKNQSLDNKANQAQDTKSAVGEVEKNEKKINIFKNSESNAKNDYHLRREEEEIEFLSFNSNDLSPKIISPNKKSNSKNRKGKKNYINDNPQNQDEGEIKNQYPKDTKNNDNNEHTNTNEISKKSSGNRDDMKIKPDNDNNYVMNNIVSIHLHPSVKVPPSYTFTYGNINVRFPYEHPYQAQKLLISNSIQAFKKSDNALLESPTGTGKSLALLSASLSFLESHPQVTRVFYTSRTHIQLQQLVVEYKKLSYFPRFSILASRRHLCIVPDVIKSNSPDNECRKLCESNLCPYIQNVITQPTMKTKTATNNSHDIEDILGPNKSNSVKNLNAIPFEFTNQGEKPKFDLDDLKDYGRKHNVCPYQLSRNIYQNAQLIFCPYNYILTPNDDKSLILDSVKDSSIVIFDEGHNIESTARDDSSLSISYKLAIETRKAAQNAPPTCPYKPLFEQVAIVVTDIINFIENKRDQYNKQYINNPDTNDNNNNSKRPKYLAGNNIKSVFSLCAKNNIQLSQVGTKMYNWLQKMMNRAPNENKFYTNDVLITFFTTCSDVFCILTQASYISFRIAFIPDERGKKERDEFRLLCMSPALLFEKIKKNARSIIIASGTLSPFDSFASELETNFGYRVSAPHVVEPSQVLTLSIKSYDKCPITSKFSVLQTRSQEIYSALSTIVLKTIKKVPGGALFFTPSYFTKDSIIKQWRNNGAYNSISNIKPIVEEKFQLPAQAIINEFASNPSGSLLVGVCRGKISEGLDFADDLARIVYVFGIPYPGFKDAEVELKMRYNDTRHSHDKNYLAGNEWYTGQAFRALFQSVGRCIRHTNDYGAIVFLDERIEKNTKKIPKWINNDFHKSTTLKQAEELLSSFYDEMKQRFPQNNKRSSLLSKNETKSFSFTEQPLNLINSNFNSNSTYVNDDIGDAEDVQTVSFKSASDLYRNSYVKYEYNNEIDSKTMNNKISKESYKEDIDEFEEVDDDDDNNYTFLTNMFCSACGSPIIRIKNLDHVDFKDISNPEFFKILDLNDYVLKIMYLMKNDIQVDFTRSTKVTKWSEKDSCLLTRKECPKCGVPIAAYVITSVSNSKLKKGEFLFRKELLSMEIHGKIMTLSEIASTF